MTSERKMRSKRIIYALFLFLMTINGFSESFRVHETIDVDIPKSMDPTTISCGINDALSINLPTNKYFIQGIEIYVKIPQSISEWADCVTWAIYNGITPSSKKSVIDYTGERIAVGNFGDAYSKIITIPIVKDNTIKKDPYTTFIDRLPDLKNNKVFFRLQLAMKGTSEDILNAKFEVTIKPILTNKGKLTINLKAPDTKYAQKDCIIFIDGKQYDKLDNGYLIEAGEHHISIQSAVYRNEVRNITIKKAEETELTVQLKDVTPLVRISAPEKTSIFLDGEEIKQTKDYFKIEEGRHSFKFIVGNYEVIKNLNAINGHNYTVSVTLDAIISDDE